MRPIARRPLGRWNRNARCTGSAGCEETRETGSEEMQCILVDSADLLNRCLFTIPLFSKCTFTSNTWSLFRWRPTRAFDLDLRLPHRLVFAGRGADLVGHGLLLQHGKQQHGVLHLASSLPKPAALAAGADGGSRRRAEGAFGNFRNHGVGIRHLEWQN